MLFSDSSQFVSICRIVTHFAIAGLGVVLLVCSTSHAAEPVRAVGEKKPSGPQVWVGLAGGLGTMLDQDDYDNEGKHLGINSGAQLGIGGFIHEHIQLGAELSFTDFEPIKRLDHNPRAIGAANYYVILLSARASIYLAEYRGVFFSGTLGPGFGSTGYAGGYSVEGGYAWSRGLLGRTSLAIGYKYTNSFNFAVYEYDAYQAFLALRIELTE
jgi:hypothetical protein